MRFEVGFHLPWWGVLTVMIAIILPPLLFYLAEFLL